MKLDEEDNAQSSLGSPTVVVNDMELEAISFTTRGTTVRFCILKSEDLREEIEELDYGQ